MTEVQVLDEGGDPITMLDFGSFRSSLFGHTVDYIRDVNKRLPDFQFRDGDILLASYPKAGCTWTYEIMTMLLQGRAEGPAYSKMHVMLEASAPENMEALASPRFLNSHLSYSRIPADIRQKRVKVVFVARNPKDVAVSLYNMMSGMKHYSYSGSFANWLPLYMRGGLAYLAYPKYLLEWEEVYKSKQHEMIVLYYEDLKTDMAKEIRRLAQFLDLPKNEKLVEEIAEKCQFHEMKTRFDAKMLGTSSYKSGTNYGFMRKGEVGNWKHWFTVAQNEMFDKYIQEQLHGSMYNFTCH